MGLIDAGVVSNRLQSALGLSESEAMIELGMLRKGISIYNLPPSLIVPLAVSIIPAIATAVAQKNKNEATSIMQSSVKLTNLFAMPAAAGIMVLAAPILTALYHDPDQSTQTFATMTTILIILGAASYFICLQHLTIATLQANGYEKVALITFPAGAIVRISLSYFLVANPDIGIIGSPVATLACFFVIVVLNIVFIKIKVKAKFSILNSFIKPLLCAGTMAAAAYFSFEFLQWAGSGFLGESVNATRLYLGLSIILSILAYGIMIILTKTISKTDLSYLPKGEKLAKLLRIH